jgi:hypothetical protein
MASWAWDTEGPLEVRERIAAPAGALYLRAEAATSEKRFALSAPCYL